MSIKGFHITNDIKDMSIKNFSYLKDGGCNENTAKEICTVTKNDHGITLCFKDYYIQINKDGWFLSDYEG